MMWQEKQANLLRREIEATLAYLSDSADFFKIVNEPVTEAIQELTNKSCQSHPWPLLPLIVCEAISGYYEQALPAAATLQFLKAAAEVFDDIEDADSSESLSTRYGNAIATNAATTLLILAERAITRLISRGVEGGIIVRVMDSVNSYYTTACAGQHLDLSLTPEMAASEDMYLKVADMKSASVTECACQVGAMLATADQDLIDKFTAFGHNLGMAAQIANDIQGIISESDILKHKITLPVIYALAQTEGDSRKRLEDLFKNESEPVVSPAGIKDLLFYTGAVQYATIKMEFYQLCALDILSEIENTGIRVEQLKLFLK